MAKRRKPLTEQEQKQIKYTNLIRQWTRYKLMYDFFTLPDDKKPCGHLHILPNGRHMCNGFVRHGEKCEFRKYDGIITDLKDDESRYNCLKPYSLGDSPIRGKTINDIEDLEKIVTEMRKQANEVRNKVAHPSP